MARVVMSGHKREAEQAGEAARQKTAQNMLRVAIDMKIPNDQFATAATIYHRFLKTEDPLNADYQKIAIGAFWSVSKATGRLREFVHSFEYFSTGSQTPTCSMTEYGRIRDELLEYERKISSAVGFNTRPVSHYSYLLNFCRYICAESDIAASAQAFLTDAFTMPICVNYSEAELAFGCLTLAVKSLGSSTTTRDLVTLLKPLDELQKEIEMSSKRLGVLVEEISDGYSFLLTPQNQQTIQKMYGEEIDIMVSRIANRKMTPLNHHHPVKYFYKRMKYKYFGTAGFSWNCCFVLICVFCKGAVTITAKELNKTKKP